MVVSLIDDFEDFASLGNIFLEENILAWNTSGESSNDQVYVEEFTLSHGGAGITEPNIKEYHKMYF